MNYKNIAIIPARGGSKRIPKKNIKDFLGKPIIAYSIEMAVSCKLFDKVIVSTDDQEIKDVAIKYGAEVPFIRPKQIADDFTGIHEVIGQAVKWLEDNGEIIDYTCCIFATAPLIKKDDLIKGFEILPLEILIISNGSSDENMQLIHNIEGSNIKHFKYTQ